jgi:hypothetical protein
VPIVLKSGSFNLLEPSGPVEACNGIALPIPFYIKYKQMRVFNFIFHLLWTARGSSVSSVDFLWFLEQKCIKKHGFGFRSGVVCCDLQKSN